MDIFISKYTPGIKMIDGRLQENNEKFVIQNMVNETDDLKNGDICTYQGYYTPEEIILINDRNGFMFRTIPERLKRLPEDTSGCVFCGNLEVIQSYKGKHICPACSLELRGR